MDVATCEQYLKSEKDTMSHKQRIWRRLKMRFWGMLSLGSGAKEAARKKKGKVRGPSRRRQNFEKCVMCVVGSNFIEWSRRKTGSVGSGSDDVTGGLLEDNFCGVVSEGRRQNAK